MRPAPDHHVAEWIATRPTSSIYTTTVTEGEIRYGMQLLPTGRRRAALELAVNRLFAEKFRDRVLVFGRDAAKAYGDIAATRRRAGRPINELDAQIAAIAFVTRAKLATRNIRDFEECGVELVNPFTSS